MRATSGSRWQRGSIAWASVSNHVDLKVGVLFAEFCDEPGQDERAQGDEAGEPHPPADLVDMATCRVENFFHVIQQGASVAQHLLTRGGQHQTAGPVTDEQLGADLVLELETAAETAD